MSSPRTPLLIIDTSLQGVSLALVDPAAAPSVLWTGQHAENMGAVAQIAALAAAGLAATGLRPAALAGVAVGVGPGSFTGIKVGLAFAYGLSAGSDRRLPMLGLSALAAAAAGLQDGAPSPLALLLPATRTHGYLAVAGAGQAAPAALVEVGEALRSRLAALPEGTRLTIFGRWPLVRELIADSGRSATERAPSDVCRYAICGMAEAAARAWPADYREALPEPRYLRPSTAEERLATQSEAQR